MNKYVHIYSTFLADLTRGEISASTTPCYHYFQDTYRFTLPLPQNVNQLPSSLESQNLSISYSLILYGRTATSYEQLDSCRVKIFGHDLINFPAEIESISVTSSNSPVHLEPPTPEKYHLVREPRFFANFEATRNIRDKVAIIVKLLDTRSLFWTQMEDKLVMDAESFKVARQRGTCLTPTHEGKMVDKNSSVKLVPFYNQRGEVISGLKIQHFVNVSKQNTNYAKVCGSISLLAYIFRVTFRQLTQFFVTCKIRVLL